MNVLRIFLLILSVHLTQGVSSAEPVGGEVTDDIDLEVDMDKFNELVDAAIDKIAEFDPVAAADLEALKANGGIKPIAPVKEGGIVVAPEAFGDYDGQTYNFVGNVVNIYISIWEIQHGDNLCGTLLHEKKHWDGDVDPDDDDKLDDDDGTIDGKELLGDVTPENIEKYRKHCELQEDVAADMCAANTLPGNPNNAFLCDTIKADFESAIDHYRLLELLGDQDAIESIANLESILSDLPEECLCLDFLPW